MIYKPLLKNKQKNDSPEYVPGTEIYGFESLLEDPTELLQEDPLLLKEDILDPALGDNKNTDISKTSKTSTNFSSPNEFKATMLAVYTKILQEKGIDTSFAKVLAAQDALESGWGKKSSGINNFGGIKSTNSSGTVKTTKEYINGQYVTISDKFRDFNSIEDYARYKVNLLNSSKYNVFVHPVNEFAFWVKRGGYATDPNYTSVLNNVINSFRQGGIIDSRWPWLENNYFKRGGVLRFASGGTGPGLNNALNAQSFLPTGHIASNLNLNSDDIFSIYSKSLGKIVDSYGDSLFINSNDYNKDKSIRYLFDIRKDLLNLDIPKESTKDIKSLTDYFKDYIDGHTNGYKKVTKLPDGRDSVAYFDSNKKYLKREGPRPENLNDGEIIRDVSTEIANINAHALAELWFLYNGISYAKRGIKIIKRQEGGWLRKWLSPSIPDEESLSENPTYIYSSDKNFDINQVASDNVKYDVIVSNRINMASDALRRAGYTNQSDIDRLAYFLAMQSIRETGWVDKDSKNNYGGYIGKGKNTYSSADEFWDQHIKNLNNKYKGWDKANNITEYLNTLNDPDWYLRPESEIKAEQSRREKIGETLWLYAPAYANNWKDYTKEVMDVADRFTYYYLN